MVLTLVLTLIRGALLLTLVASLNAQQCGNKLRVGGSNIGMRLDGHLIVEYGTNWNLHGCASQCTSITHCLSFNFARELGVCQLNSANKSHVDVSQFVANASFIYIDIFSWPQRPSYVCSTKPCSGTDRCVSTGKTPLCLRTGCSEPPSLLNDGALVPGNVTMGSVRKYVCPVRSTLQGNSAITCTGSAWSTPQFKCDYDCSEPPSTLNEASLVPGNVTIGSVRKYVCPVEKILKGNSTITCIGSVWSTSQFTCDYVRSCADLQVCNSDYTDGEYWLYPLPYGTTPAKIYCHNMTSNSPGAYITVSPKKNLSTFASAIVAKRRRLDFTKIGIDVETMVVDRFDLTFGTYSGTGTNPLWYGMAGDCKCHYYCWPLANKGQFRIDTSTTGLVLDPTITWGTYDYQPKMSDLERSADGTVIMAYCGGLCGHCEANKTMALHLNPTYVVDSSAATFPSCTQTA